LQRLIRQQDREELLVRGYWTNPFEKKKLLIRRKTECDEQILQQ
jgi:hypothetical protein